MSRRPGRTDDIGVVSPVPRALRIASLRVQVCARSPVSPGARTSDGSTSMARPPRRRRPASRRSPSRGAGRTGTARRATRRAAWRTHGRPCASLPHAGQSRPDVTAPGPSRDRACASRAVAAATSASASDVRLHSHRAGRQLQVRRSLVGLALALERTPDEQVGVGLVRVGGEHLARGLDRGTEQRGVVVRARQQEPASVRRGRLSSGLSSSSRSSTIASR